MIPGRSATSRRHLLLGATAALALQTRPLSAAARLSPVAPADAGFAPDLEARLDKAIAGKRVWNLHGVVVVRDDRLVLERYFEGEDNARGRPLGKVTFKPDTLHDMRSVSKGVVALLYGIALEQGKVPPPEAPLFASFPEYADLGRARGTRAAHHPSRTLHDHGNGLGRDEPSLYRSEQQRDRDGPGAGPLPLCPGAARRRGSPAAGLLTPAARPRCWRGSSRRRAGKSLHAFARETLFDPLGLGPTEWQTGRDGEPIAASGLRMAPRDLARIGTMMLRGGMSEGRQVVLVAMARTLHVADRERR